MERVIATLKRRTPATVRSPTFVNLRTSDMARTWRDFSRRANRISRGHRAQHPASTDRMLEHANSSNLEPQAIARLQPSWRRSECADASRCAGGDDVAG